VVVSVPLHEFFLTSYPQNIMSAKYAEFSGLNLPAIEQEILAKWKAESAFEKSIDLREGKKALRLF
jgi:isoleucyl-tRNA synthetase